MEKQIVCILCQKSEESKITGALSTKDSITAHQNCLLYSAGLICENSPEFDDLFGFSVEDVENEVKRGRKLFCDICKQRGATAGCEVKRCKKSFHYPCAVGSGAEQVDDEVEGTYLLYCYKHKRAEPKDNDSTVTDRETQTKKPSKVYCLVCEKKEESISLENMNTDIKLYCEKHKPSSWNKEPNGYDAVAGPSHHSSDSNSPNGRRCSKRHLSHNSKQEGTPSKPKVSRRIMDSDSDEDESDAPMAIFAPIECDLDDSVNSTPEPKNPEPESIRNVSDLPVASTSGNHLHQCKEEDKDGDLKIIDSDEESQSLLQPASIFVGVDNGSRLVQVKGCSPGQSPGTCLGSPVGPDQHTATGPQDHSAGPADHPPSPVSSEPPNVPSRPPHMSSPVSAAPHVDNSASISPPPPSHSFLIPSPRAPPPFPMSLPSAMPLGLVTEPSYDSAGFWKGCNEAGCTHAIFSDFIAEMTNLSNRIQSGQASQEDYNLSLRVMEASGKLQELVAKQEEGLKTKQEELQRAVAAMKKVRSALKR